MPRTKKSKKIKAESGAESYRHPEAESPMRPDVGTQAQFKKKKPPATYRYDSSLSPALDWDGQNSAREIGERQLSVIEEKLSVARRQLSVEKTSTADLEVAAASLGQAEDAMRALKALSRPFLNWAGKAERLSFDVPTLPLFVHERLSTKAIIETLSSHKRDKQLDMYSLFGDPQHSVADQVLRAYEYQDEWVNRMILGDSLVVMNSFLHYEGLGGQVQMVYMDPPYGVKFGSNFQPFVRQRSVSEVKHNDDDSLTREPEMVQAYRDTWDLGLHSYLTYLRDRLLLARELLTPSGSIFVQISDQNLHHLREVMDEVFGPENFIVTFLVKKKGGQKGELIDPVNDYLLWFAKDVTRCRERFHQLYERAEVDPELSETFRYAEMPDGRDVTLNDLSQEGDSGVDYTQHPERVFIDFPGARIFKAENITSGGYRRTQSVIYKFKGQQYDPGISKGNCWKHSAITDDDSPSGMDKLAAAGRLFVGDKQLAFRRYTNDFGYTAISNWWDGLGGAAKPVYVVQTNPEIVKRCILMTTNPGELVLDPTCGSGTTAYVAEQWGRRWVTIDTSRVPLALARQRLLTATFPWYELNDNARGPTGGFVYRRKQNNKGEEVGGIVPHITSSTIANDEPPMEEVLVDRPEADNKITRVTGAFCVEGTIPTPVDLEASEAAIRESEISDLREGAIGDARISDLKESTSREGQSTFTDRMLEILRKSPLLRLEGNRTLALKNIRPPAKTLSLSAEALVDATAPGQSPTLQDALQEAAEKNGKALPLSAKPVALVFGPENGAISERLVQEAAKEAWLKNYTHLYVIGFAIQPNARQLIENCDKVVGIPATYIQATPDLLMGDLLKNMRSSQIFSVCGLPEIKVHPVAAVSDRRQEDGGGDTAATGSGAGGSKISDLRFENKTYQVELLGLDVFDPVTMDAAHRSGNDVPAWFLDTNYNGLCFHVSQAFFPRTSAWDNLKKALKSEFEESVWEHLSGTTSAPFETGENRQIAVKVIDDRGNELMVVEKLR
jgi:adenine-specific DNA-methyltransferase